MMACVESVQEYSVSLSTGSLVATPSSVETPSTVRPPAHTGGHVFLNEEKAVITPTHDAKNRGEVLFLDMGATNHMTGSANAFTELDRSISGKVWFADRSVVEIHGRGTVVFAVDGGDHRTFMDVFFIPALRSSVISLVLLDENWYDIAICRRALTLRDQRNRHLILATSASTTPASTDGTTRN